MQFIVIIFILGWIISQCSSEPEKQESQIEIDCREKGWRAADPYILLEDYHEANRQRHLYESSCLADANAAKQVASVAAEPSHIPEPTIECEGIKPTKELIMDVIGDKHLLYTFQMRSPLLLSIVRLRQYLG